MNAIEPPLIDLNPGQGDSSDFNRTDTSGVMFLNSQFIDTRC